MDFFRRLFSGGWQATGGDHDRALAEWSEAIRLDPANADSYVDRGWVAAEDERRVAELMNG